MVVIRLARHGAKKRPFYHVVVADRRCPRDGRNLERLGYFNPMAKEHEEGIKIDLEKVSQWVAKGAQMSERVKQLVEKIS